MHRNEFGVDVQGIGSWFCVSSLSLSYDTILLKTFRLWDGERGDGNTITHLALRAREF